MKLNNNIIIACGALFLGMTVLTGCSGDEEYDVDGISYIRVFLERAGSVSDGTVLTTPVGTVVSFSDAMLAKVTSPVATNTQVTFSVDNSLVKTYNDSHNTNYSQLPDGVLKMDKTTLTIPANAYSSEESLILSIDEEAAKTLDNLDGYLAPVVISSVDNGNVRPSSDASVRYVHINYAKTNSLINDEADVIVGTTADITSLSCIAATDLNPEELSGLAIGGYYAQWKFISDVDTDASFTIDFGETHKVAGFYIDSYVISNAYVEISMDNSKWVELGNTSEHDELAEYDYTTYEYKQEFVLYAPVQARYMRATLKLDDSQYGGYYWQRYRCIRGLSIYYAD